MNLIRTIDLDSNISVDIVTVKSIKNHIWSIKLNWTNANS
jgi:hypothetical protein